MNFNQIINLVLRMVMRQVVGRGINAGINMASKKMKKTDDGAGAGDAAGLDGTQSAARAKKAMKVNRRMTRL